MKLSEVLRLGSLMVLVIYWLKKKIIINEDSLQLNGERQFIGGI